MTFSYNANIPQSSDNPSVSQSSLLQNTSSLSGIISVDHIGELPLCNRVLLAATFYPNSQEGTRGETLNYNVSVTNDAPQICGTKTFSLRAWVSGGYPSGASLPDWSIINLPSIITLAPGESKSFTLSNFSGFA